MRAEATDTVQATGRRAMFTLQHVQLRHQALWDPQLMRIDQRVTTAFGRRGGCGNGHIRTLAGALSGGQARPGIPWPAGCDVLSGTMWPPDTSLPPVSECSYTWTYFPTTNLLYRDINIQD